MRPTQAGGIAKAWLRSFIYIKQERKRNAGLFLDKALRAGSGISDGGLLFSVWGVAGIPSRNRPVLRKNKSS
jgi:hypothetical protein